MIFTVNLMVASKAKWREMRAEMGHLPERPSPGVHYGKWASPERIGILLPEGEDVWWRVYPGVDLHAVRDAVIDAVGTYGVPWLRSEMSTHACGYE